MWPFEVFYVRDVHGDILPSLMVKCVKCHCHLILLCKGFVTSLLGALVVGAVLSGQVPPVGQHDHGDSNVDASGLGCEKGLGGSPVGGLPPKPRPELQLRS